jgi:flagellar biosynthesis/type III secretory pathway M-ring protein FliF/YscJ
VGFLKGLGASRLMAMVAVTTALLGFFAFVIMRVTTPQMTTLFTDLSIEDSSAIIKDLAQGRRRRLRDFRQIRRARHHQLRPEYQSSARA